MMPWLLFSTVLFIVGHHALDCAYIVVYFSLSLFTLLWCTILFFLPNTLLCIIYTLILQVYIHSKKCTNVLCWLNWQSHFHHFVGTCCWQCLFILLVVVIFGLQSQNSMPFSGSWPAVMWSGWMSVIGNILVK